MDQRTHDLAQKWFEYDLQKWELILEGVQLLNTHLEEGKQNPKLLKHNAGFILELQEYILGRKGVDWREYVAKHPGDSLIPTGLLNQVFPKESIAVKAEQG